MKRRKNIVDRALIIPVIHKLGSASDGFPNHTPPVKCFCATARVQGPHFAVRISKLSPGLLGRDPLGAFSKRSATQFSAICEGQFRFLDRVFVSQTMSFLDRRRHIAQALLVTNASSAFGRKDWPIRNGRTRYLRCHGRGDGQQSNECKPFHRNPFSISLRSASGREGLGSPCSAIHESSARSWAGSSFT